MSGAAVAARGASAASKSASRSGWLASLKDDAVSFLKGDNNAPWAILAESVIGCIPVLGQLVDARDIIKGLIEVSAAPTSPAAWFNLITALIGLVPGGGDAAKRSMRAVKSGAVHTDELLDMIRRLYKGDPEKLLKEVLDVSKLRKQLDAILSNPKLREHLGPESSKRLDSIQRNLGQQFDAFKREIDGWLTKGRRTSANGGTGTKATPGSPAAKPNTQAKSGAQAKTKQGDGASSNTPNAATQRTARFKSLTQKVLGVLGEHMADYHCQDVKGWGRKARHDSGDKNSAKLNDSGHMVQLWPCVPRGRGIDAVWSTPGGKKPYAVIEAKASYDPTKSLGALLGEAGDKAGSDGSNGGTLRRRSGAGGASSQGASAIRQTNGKVTQMGKSWVNTRLLKATGSKRIASDISTNGYSRYVLFFSIPHAAAHAEALILCASGHVSKHESHAAHHLTREWGDADIDKVVDNRAGMKGEARDQRKR
ncbi:hypothetical protein [Aquabacterium parvum]|jgi:hypothetical protein|uniref:hypothetical protein n=1 Tax=Aquabacterium parvum TaxID=70584 RepID=UPI000718F188|nr:hypothetical protein [Aquabacterium parvum]MBU0916123.1 hypothetical protein [Gammaproteobacteria bacterium]